MADLVPNINDALKAQREQAARDKAGWDQAWNKIFEISGLNEEFQRIRTDFRWDIADNTGRVKLAQAVALASAHIERIPPLKIAAFARLLIAEIEKDPAELNGAQAEFAQFVRSYVQHFGSADELGSRLLKAARYVDGTVLTAAAREPVGRATARLQAQAQDKITAALNGESGPALSR